eukprot:15362386-Ditylum_brightwellii.AAC.1
MARLRKWDALLMGRATAPLSDLQHDLSTFKSPTSATWVQCIVQCQHFTVVQALLISKNYHTTQCLATICKEICANNLLYAEDTREQPKLPLFLLHCIHMQWHTYFYSVLTWDIEILPSLNNLLNKLHSHCVHQPSLPRSLLNIQDAAQQQPLTQLPQQTPTANVPPAQQPPTSHNHNHQAGSQAGSQAGRQFATSQDCGEQIRNDNLGNLQLPPPHQLTQHDCSRTHCKLCPTLC